MISVALLIVAFFLFVLAVIVFRRAQLVRRKHRTAVADFKARLILARAVALIPRQPCGGGDLDLVRCGLPRDHAGPHMYTHDDINAAGYHLQPF